MCPSRRPGVDGERGRERTGATEQIALHEVAAEIDEGVALGGGLDADPDQAHAELGAQHRDALDVLATGGVVVDVAHQVGVDLDDVGAQLDEQPEAATSAAEVVDGELEAELAQGGGVARGLAEADRGVAFGDLQHDTRGERGQRRREGQQVRIVEVARVEVHVHAQVVREVAQRRGDVATHGAADVPQAPERLGRGEEVLRPGQRRLLRAHEPLVGHDPQVRPAHDRLVDHADRRQRPIERARERLAVGRRVGALLINGERGRALLGVATDGDALFGGATQHRGLDGLQQVALRPLFEGPDRGRQMAASGHQENGQVRVALVNRLQHLHAVRDRHGDVADDHVEFLVIDPRADAEAPLHDLDIEAAALQYAAIGVEHQRLVVDQQDPAARRG